MNKIIKSKFFPALFLTLVTIFIFYNLPSTFYQQDEWQTLGHILSEGIGVFANTGLLQLLFGELRPFSTLLYLLLFGVFKFTVVPSAIFGILFHIINAILTFYLVDKITKKRLIAFIASIFLITNSVSSQAVTWASAIGTLPATTLILIAVITYLKYLEKADKKYLVASFFSAILSFYFKGIGLSLFILLPVMTFMFKNKPINRKSIREVFMINLPLFVFAFLTLVFRFIEVFFRSEKVAGFAVGGGNTGFVQTVLLHSILYPLTSLFQVFTPSLDLYSITTSVTKIQYKFLVNSPLTDLVSQTIVADMVSLFGAFVILGLIGFIIFRSKDKIMNRNILFALLFFFLSFLPYIVLDRGSAYLESRYSYVGAIGAGILLGYVVYLLVSVNKYIKWTIIALVVLFLFYHASIIRRDINYQVTLGDSRQAVLTGIRDNYPNLSDKNIFYVTSDKEYYGPITNPFQNGLGYVLEVYYYDSGKIPKSFLSENFLWDLGSEGYKEKGNYGFGYFQDIDKMTVAMEKNRLSTTSVHAFFFNSKNNEILNITSQTREKLATISAIPK